MRPVTLALVAATVTATPAVAQDRSVLSALDVAGRVVATDAGQIQGSLTSEDLIYTAGRRVQVWDLDAGVGDELQVDMASADFDAYLYIVGPGLGEGLSDDDSGDGLDARVCVVLDEPGQYRVVASSLSSGTGAFTLRVTERPGVIDGACPEEPTEGSTNFDDIAQLPTDGRVLRIGSEFTGELSADDPTVVGSPSEAWAFEGTAGQGLSVDLVSDVFDTYLMVAGPGLDSWLLNDDGAGGCNARITFALPETGLYRVVASSLGTAAGPYRLLVTETPGPTSSEACNVGSSDAPAESFDDVAVVGSLEWQTTVEGTLSGNEGTYDSRLLQAWTLDAFAGVRASIEVRSSDFDSYVYLTGPGFEAPIYNDDGAGDLHSRLCVELPYEGTYRVMAGPYSGGAAGQRYTIQASMTDAEAECEQADFEVSTDAIADWLLALPTEGRALTLGTEQTSALDSEDPRHPETDRPIEPWSFEGVAGRTVYVDVVSDDFDAVLYAVGAGLDGVLYIDDSEAGCNSRMAITPSESGRILLLPGALSADEGPFLLRASENPASIEDNECSFTDATTGVLADADALEGISSGTDRPIELIAVVSDSLGVDDEHRSSGEPAKAWTLNVRAGEEIEITLVSEEFDPVLYVDGPTLSPPLMDDDSAGDLDSRITYTPAEESMLRIVVSAYAADASGGFELRIVRRSP